MTATIVEDYRPSLALDTELAGLAYECISDWPDQRPVSPSLVRSLLRPAGMTATTLALHRDDDGDLVAAAALCWPATLDEHGRLWGPVVRPGAQGRGLGSALLAAVTDIIAVHPGIIFTTSEIPHTRTIGWSLFEQHADWRQSATLTMLARPLPAHVAPSTIDTRQARTGEYLDAAIAQLAASCRPQLCLTGARDTFARWRADSRYDPNCLILAMDSSQLIGAALAYPSEHTRPNEPAELFLADLMTSTLLDQAVAAAVRAALVAGVLRAGQAVGASVARTVVDDADLIATLTQVGFIVVDHVHRYTQVHQREPANRWPGRDAPAAHLSRRPG